MSKVFVLVFMGVALYSINVFADDSSGICRDTGGWYVHPDRKGCLINDSNMGCVACGFLESCNCQIENVIVKQSGDFWYPLTMDPVPSFLCRFNAVWVAQQDLDCGETPTEPYPDPDPNPDPDPEPTPEPDPSMICSTSRYTTVNGKGETICVPCPVPVGLKPDTDYSDADTNPLDFIRSDGKNRASCMLSYMDMPYWQDNTGKFEIFNSCGYEE